MAKDNKYGFVAIKGIHEDEPVFILRAQDLTAVAVLRFYQNVQVSREVKSSVDLSIARFNAWPTKKMPS